MRVLVIEDDTTLGHALQEFLSSQGYAVDWLKEGDRVEGAVAGQAYDLLLLDLNLPGMGGLEVLRHLRGSGYQGQVLILTARDGLDDRVAGLDAGADDYVTKQQIVNSLSAWDADFSENAVEVYIYRLRKRLDGTGASIQTVRGFGYLLDVENAA
jgi:two-component system OmpR family response regulator